MERANEPSGTRIVILLLTLVSVGSACGSPGTRAGRPPATGAAVASLETTAPPAAPANLDPTVGKLMNETRWRVEVFIDTGPDSLGTAPSLTLNPQDTRPAHLDLGPHRIIALAFVDTQFGSRRVGQFDRTVQVDPRGHGWSLRFAEGLFR